MSRIAKAQVYPSRPVRIIVPNPPSGPNDILARLMGQWLSERFGQPFIVENRPGVGTNIGTEAVVKAPADGYTLLFAGSPADFGKFIADETEKWGKVVRAADIKPD